MTRVSDTSNQAAVSFSINNAKNKLQDLQLKGSTLKKIVRPSDDPIGNVDLLSMRSQTVDNEQFKRNNNFAITQLEFTESSLSDLQDVLNKAKEIAISQSSDIYNNDVRKNVAQEISQLYKQAVGISNRRLGSRFIFAGHSTLNQPFNAEGKYKGDDGHTFLEVSKDFFAPINVTGLEVFYVNQDSKNIRGEDKTIKEVDSENNNIEDNKKNQEYNPNLEVNRNIASTFDSQKASDKESVFDQLKTLERALITGDTDSIQDLLPRLDQSISQVIEIRTRIGSLTNSIQNADTALDQMNLNLAEYKSKIEDADVAELFSDLKRQQQILEATYKISANVSNKSLLDFIR